jgi:hypothetical protein
MGSCILSGLVSQAPTGVHGAFLAGSKCSVTVTAVLAKTGTVITILLVLFLHCCHSNCYYLLSFSLFFHTGV